MKGKVYFLNAYKINIFTEEVNKVTLNNDNKSKVIDDLLDGIFNKKNYRRYRIKRNVSNITKSESEVAASNENAINTWAQDLDTLSNQLAITLEEIQVDRQNEIAQLKTEIKTSTFVHALVETDNGIKHILAKFEHKAFLDESDLKERVGIPVEGTVLKSCVYSYDSSKNLIDIKVTDNSGRFATYWWSDFLGLEPIITDEDNSKTAIESIQSAINRSLVKYPEDKMILINKFNSYIKTNEQYNHEDVLTKLFTEYIPINKEAQKRIDNLKNKIETLPEKKHFETSFTIIPKEVKKFSHSIKIDDNMNININGVLDDFKDKFDVSMEGLTRVLKIKDIDKETYRNIENICKSKN